MKNFGSNPNSNNTVRIYVPFFEMFINFYNDRELKTLDEGDIRVFLQHLIQRKLSNSYINQVINAIKFYYEEVLWGAPQIL
ncbi:hypothetical protein ES765_19940 [Maribacter sp. ACAM166]|nr:hypothetical protein ES765_19940 [Maribacter sp. ACAM166]